MPIAERMRCRERMHEKEGVSMEFEPTQRALIESREAKALAGSERVRRGLEGMMRAPSYGSATPVPNHAPTTKKQPFSRKKAAPPNKGANGGLITTKVDPDALKAYFDRTARPDAEARRTAKYQPPIINGRLAR